jgi:hypothetical protein
LTLSRQAARTARRSLRASRHFQNNHPKDVFVVAIVGALIAVVAVIALGTLVGSF